MVYAYSSRRFNDRHGFARVRAPRRAAPYVYVVRTHVRSFTRPVKRKVERDPGTVEHFGKMTKIYQLRSTVNDRLGSSPAASPVRRNPMTRVFGRRKSAIKRNSRELAGACLIEWPISPVH